MLPFPPPLGVLPAAPDLVPAAAPSPPEPSPALPPAPAPSSPVASSLLQLTISADSKLTTLRDHPERLNVVDTAGLNHGTSH
jgi:hypothetical protein